MIDSLIHLSWYIDSISKSIVNHKKAYTDFAEICLVILILRIITSSL